MQARMTNPAMLLSDAMPAIQKLYSAMHSGGLPATTLELVHLRASQINACSACVHAGVGASRKAGVPEEQLDALAAWYEASCFSAAERAALALTEAATRIADRTGEAVSDEIWNAAAEHYDDKQLAALILMIATTNFFNRINTTIKEPAGATWN